MSPFDNLYLKGLSSILDVFNINQHEFFDVMLFVSLSISNEFGCKLKLSSSHVNSHNFWITEDEFSNVFVSSILFSFRIKIPPSFVFIDSGIIETLS